MSNETYYAALRAAGHVWKTHGDGEVHSFVHSSGFHNGPGCTLCGDNWCEHCEDKIEPCKGPPSPVDKLRSAIRIAGYEPDEEQLQKMLDLLGSPAP